jgi:2'-5' RNA ligase
MPAATSPEPHGALAARYEAVWEDAAPAVRAGRGIIDPCVTRKDADSRRGLTLLARPGASLARRLEDFLARLRAAEPEQYFQPAADLHLTVFSLFGTTAEHAPYLARLDDYRAAAAQALRGVPAFTVDVEGVTLSRGAVLAQGFPRDGTLEWVRDRLRAALAARGLDGGLNQRYRLMTAHLTLVRFAAPLRRPDAFVQALAAARRRAFGEMEARELELVVGDWYQSAERTRLVHTHALSAPPSA